MDYRFDLEETKLNILEKYPEWESLAGIVEFKNSSGDSGVPGGSGVLGIRDVPGSFGGLGFRSFAGNHGEAPAWYGAGTVYYDSRRMRSFSEGAQAFFIALQLMHIQLSHFQRGRRRLRSIWDAACNAVAAELLIADGFEAPPGLGRRRDAAGLSAEEMYDILCAEAGVNGMSDDEHPEDADDNRSDNASDNVSGDEFDDKAPDEDPRDEVSDDEPDEDSDAEPDDGTRDVFSDGKRDEPELVLSDEERRAPGDALYDGELSKRDERTESYESPDGSAAEDAVNVLQAFALKGARVRDIEDPGLARAVAGLPDLMEASTQLDYDWFPADRIRDGVLIEQFRPYPVPHAEILLDTSASIDQDLLRAFVRGVRELLRDDAVVRVGCFDTEFYGFQEIHSEKDIASLEIKGAGGTNFETAVRAFTGDAETKIIFTDGYADMPETRCDAIWLVYSDMPVDPPGGRVIYVKKPEERIKNEVDFLIT